MWTSRVKVMYGYYHYVCRLSCLSMIIVYDSVNRFILLTQCTQQISCFHLLYVGRSGNHALTGTQYHCGTVGNQWYRVYVYLCCIYNACPRAQILCVHILLRRQRQLHINSLWSNAAIQLHGACPALVELTTCGLHGHGEKPLPEPMLPYCWLDPQE